METISVALVCTILGCGISALAYRNGRDKDITKNAKEEAAISVKLDLLISDVKEIKEDTKKNNKEIVRINESLKSAHKRIDDLNEIILKMKGER